MGGSKAARRYKRIDLSIFALMVILFESVIILAETRWFPGQPYTVSVTGAIVAIVMIRWGPWAAAHAVLGGALFCFMSGGGPKQYLIYCAGNLFSLLGLLLVRGLGGEEKVRQDVMKTLLYALCVQLLMQAGRGAMAMLLGTPIEGAEAFITTDVMSLLFSLVVLWIVRRLDGVLENQYHYLLRLGEEREKERGGFR